jgi:hypothetical protein
MSPPPKAAAAVKQEDQEEQTRKNRWLKMVYEEVKQKQVEARASKIKGG